MCVGGGGDRIHEGYTRDPVTSLALLVLLSPRLWSYDVNLGDSAYRRDMCCPEHEEASFPRADPSAACRTLATFLEEGGLCPFSVCDLRQAAHTSEPQWTQWLGGEGDKHLTCFEDPDISGYLAHSRTSHQAHSRS